MRPEAGPAFVTLDVVHDEPIAFHYVVRDIPPARFPFRRWRWELWQGMVLVSAGWVTAPAKIEMALRRAASRRMHQLAGVTALRPERARLLDVLAADRAARLETGVGRCLLVAAGAASDGATTA